MTPFIIAIMDVLKKDKWIALACVALLSFSETYQGYQASEINLALKETNLQMASIAEQQAITDARSIKNQETLVQIQKESSDFQKVMWEELSKITRISQELAIRAGVKSQSLGHESN